MNYISTRDDVKQEITAGQAICRGIAPDVGLYLPKDIPAVSAEQLAAWKDLSYSALAVEILSLYLSDYDKAQLEACVSAAYAEDKWSDKRIAPTSFCEKFGLLELFHGPTSAFKDVALQLLPHLLVTARRNLKIENISLILVATSGDTGKAALEGFADVDGTAIAVFYPKYGVSPLQQLQMQTQKGKNVAVFGIEGNFDDAQTGVKALFTDAKMQQILAENHADFSSANSINWGRLCPQIVYYFAAYFDMVRGGKIAFGDRLNFCVPTGNFGDILAGYYAKKMGLPVGKLICASNANCVLTDFFRTGRYNRKREFYQTASPSMDILISSNLERLIYLAYDQDSVKTADLFRQLKENGEYQIDSQILSRLQQDFAADYCEDAEAFDAISDLFEKEKVLIDPHTAVGVKVLEKYRSETQDSTPCVVLSTASPYKFCRDVLGAINHEEYPQDIDPFVVLETLEGRSDVEAPQRLKSLKKMPIRFDQVIGKEDQADAVLHFLETL